VNIVNGNRRPHPVDGENCCWSFSALTLIWSLTLLMSCVAPVSAAGKQPVDYVQPFFNTSGDHGQLFPGPVAPFGMIQLSPDSYPSGFDHKAHSGYNYEDTRLMGFSHVRLGGTGCSGSGGNILFLPFTGQPQLNPADYAAAYDKQSEKAEPGYYRVDLIDPRIRCELTVTPHGGLQRYRFPAGDSVHVLVDLSRGFTQVREAAITGLDHSHIEGYVTGQHICGSLDSYTLYFCAEWNRPCSAYHVYQDGVLQNDTGNLRGPGLAVVLDFPSHRPSTLMIKSGLSTVSSTKACANYRAEMPEWNFQRVRRSMRKSWNDLLKTVQVSGTEERKQLFYTALYHSCHMPVRAADVDGEYRGTDNAVHRISFPYYDAYSLWDTFRTKYPLLSLIQPQVLQDIVRSFVLIYDQGGRYWPYPTTRREHTVAVIADAYFKGLRAFDLEKAYQGMRRDAYEFRAEFNNATTGDKTMMSDSAMKAIYEEYHRLGYMPRRPDRTLENCYDSWCVARMAQSLGKAEEHQLFAKRALFYRNVWDPQIRFFRARAADGAWLRFPDPRVIDETYVYEATMWQWRWFVLHDIPGLIELCGGRERFIEDLDFFFANDLYNHNNEQDLHVSFLYNPAGAPWRTQELVQRILTGSMRQIYGSHGFYKEPYEGRIYKAQPASFLYEMDDDCGTMSAWYVLASLGLYQICVGEPVFQLTSPLFDQSVIHTNPSLRSGKRFTIRARNLSDQNKYIQSATLNGRPLNRCQLTYQEIVSGGELVYSMGPAPNTRWGVD